MLEKLSAKQAYLDYESEQAFEKKKKKNYYMLLATHFHCTDCAIYEDTIINLIGKRGLELIRKHKLVESCGVINKRKLYAL